jgi:hypothetical protein
MCEGVRRRGLLGQRWLLGLSSKAAAATIKEKSILVFVV